MNTTRQPDEPPAASTSLPAARPIRLGIIHLIGWMASCGAALAILRVSSDDSQIAPGQLLAAQLTQALVGIAYGTALGGLALLVYRRVRHSSRFPSQPGHWLFLLGTIGLLLDGGAQWAARVAAGWWNERHSPRLPVYWCYQSLGWSLGLAIGAVALWFIARSQPWRWVALAAGVWLAVAANAVTHSLILARELSGGSVPWLWGLWPYYYAAILRIGGDGLSLVLLAVAVAIELRARVPRDWLHWSGVFAGAALPIVDGANRAWEFFHTRW